MRKVWLALLVPIMFAAPAHADDDAFVSDLHKQGIYGADLVLAGHFICQQLASGVNPEALASDIDQNSGLSHYEARQEVLDAVLDLCPNYLR